MLAVFCVSCRTPLSHDEVARVLSPGGTLEASVTETNGGATTSCGYDVSIASRGSSKGERVASLYGAVRNAQAYGVNLHWNGSSTLEVRYLSAKSVSFIRDQVDLDGQQVRVVLQQGIEDPSAPPGSMLFNLKKQRP
jgi:hypothetical protein